MSTITLKEFPDQLHREIKAKAALMGISMKELIVRALTQYLQKGGDHGRKSQAEKR